MKENGELIPFREGLERQLNLKLIPFGFAFGLTLNCFGLLSWLIVLSVLNLIMGSVDYALAGAAFIFGWLGLTSSILLNNHLHRKTRKSVLKWHGMQLHLAVLSTGLFLVIATSVIDYPNKLLQISLLVKFIVFSIVIAALFAFANAAKLKNNSSIVPDDKKE